MMQYVIGVDSSTQSTKAIVCELDGTALAQGRAELAVQTPQPGWAEQDPDTWRRSTVAALRQAVAGLRLRGGYSTEVAAIGLAWQRETFVALDAGGNPLRPAILWLDQRASREAELARAEFGAERFLRLTGKQLDTTPSFSKLAWMRRNEADRYAGLDQVLDVGAYLTRGLTGQPVTSIVGADSLCLMDLERGVWSAEILDYLGLQERNMPRIVPAGALLGGLAPDVAAEVGLPAGLPVVAAGGDGQVFAVGVGACDATVLSLTVGTSLVLGVHWPEYRVGPAFRTMAGCFPGTFLLEAVLRAGADVVRWFVRDFAPGQSEEAMEQEIRRVPPGSLGLLTVPYWKGRMVPTNEPMARGVTVGWSNYHTLAHLYRSILEGMAYEVRLLVDALRKDLCIDPREIHLGGGGALSAEWRQMMADITGLEVVLSATESTALGAAMMAAVFVGAYPTLAAASEAMYRPAERIRPRADAGLVYAELYEEYYSRLYPLLELLLVGIGRRTVERGDGRAMKEEG